MEKLNIVPIGKIDQKILDYLKAELEKKFGLKVEFTEPLEKSSSFCSNCLTLLPKKN